MPGSVPSPSLQLWVGLGNTSVLLPRTQLALAPFLAFQRSEAGPPPPSQWQECGEERATNSRGSGFLCGHDGGIPGRFLAFIQKKRKLQFLPPAPGPPGPAPPPSPRLSCAPPLRPELARNSWRTWNYAGQMYGRVQGCKKAQQRKRRCVCVCVGGNKIA